MMKITKHKDGDTWRVSVDGIPTMIWIEKGPAPKFGYPQTWDVEMPQRYLFEAKGLDHAMRILEAIASQLVRP